MKPNKRGKAVLPAETNGLPLWPGLVADLYRYRPFIFPGEIIPPPPPMPLAVLGELVRERAAMIEKPRFEGLPEFWAGALAGELLEWLAGRATAGSEHAQAGIVKLARKAVDWHSLGISQGHETTLECARNAPDMPGRVSLNPEVTADWQALLERIGQGSENPVPTKRGKRRNVFGANHRLVNWLWQYMEGYRNHAVAKVVGVQSNHPEIPGRVREILLLPALGLKGDAWKKWHKVGMEIVNDATEGKPAEHEAFKSPGLASLIVNRDAQCKSPLARDLHAAWKALASSKSSLEVGL